jgi:WD40 repeat protein
LGIEASVGQFKLFLVRCNYTSLRSQLVERLRELTSVEIRVLELKKSEKTLYARIQNELGTEKLDVLMVFGLESVDDLDQLLTATNQVREEFRKHFHFPLVLWVNDEVLTKLLQLAPDFESWANTTEFVIATDELVNFLKQTAEPFLTEDLTLSAETCQEIKQACQDLQHREPELNLELKAIRESLLGWSESVNNHLDSALDHYQKGLELWQQTNHLEAQGRVLYYITLGYYIKAVRHREIEHQDWQLTGRYLRQCLEVFEQANRPDFVANSMRRFGRILSQLQEWELLETLAQKALQQHQAENKPIEVAQDYSFLAEVALVNKEGRKAKELAENAIQILVTVPSVTSSNQGEVVDEQLHQSLLSYARSQYQFILAKAEQQLGQIQAAIRNLEEAKELGSPEYDPQLYIDILCHLQKLYFEQKQYLKAFELKLEQQSIEQQYGLRAFVGAAWIQPQRRAKLALTQVENQESIAPEIAASGRQLDVERLIERIGRNDCKLIVIHGPSGVGKSSLVNGGLVPALKQKAIGTSDVLPVPMRVYTHWVGELGKGLAEAIAQRENRTSPPTPLLGGEGSPTPPFPSREGGLGGLGLEATILEQLKQTEQRNLRTVLIFDQFEEFFFVYPDARERRRFWEFVGECLNILSVKVILSLREDYLHYLLECDRLPSMKIIGNDILTQNVRYPLGNFSRDDTQSIIERLTQRSSFHLDSDLIEQLVQDLASELGEVRPIELQVVGAQLQTDQITTLTKYREFGTKQELVKRYLNEVVESCGTENQQAAELLLYLLTDEKGTRPLRTRAELERDLQTLSLAQLTAEPNPLDLVLQIFVKSGLVLLLPENPEQRYQLVHDYLAAFIRQQQEPRLNELIAELEKERKQRQEAEAQRQLTQEELKRAEQARQILEDANQKAEEKNKKANQRILLGSGVLVISLVAAAVIGVFAGKAYQDLKEAQTGTRLERDGMNAVQQFEFYQIEALLSAMQSGQELKALVKNRPLENYPTATPMLALQTILDTIHERTQLKGHTSPVTSASFSPDGKRIVTASYDKTAKIWDRSGKLVADLKGHTSDVRSASFSPDGKLLVTASSDNTAKIWDRSGKLVADLKGHQDIVTSASFSPDGKLLVTASYDNTAKIWETSGKLVADLKGHSSNVTSASFSPDGKQILTASSDKTAKIWDRSGKLVADLKGHTSGVNSASFNPDGKQILTASSDNTAKIWDRSGKLVADLKGHTSGVNSASFSRDGKLLVTASDDTIAKIWDRSGKLVADLKGHSSNVTSASFSRDGKQILTASFDNTTKIWETSGKLVADLKGHTSPVNSASFSPDGKQILTASYDNTTKIWDRSGKLVADLKGHQDTVTSASFSRDGKQILTASSDKTAKIWDRSGKLVADLKGHQDIVTSASFSRDGKQILTASSDKTAKIWDRSGKLVADLKGHTSFVNSASFSPDGKLLVTASSDNTTKIWDRSGKLVADLKGHTSFVTSASFSPDGKLLVTASSDNTTKIWDRSGKLVADLKGHQDTVNSASFSPDGKQILTASDDKTAKIWDRSGKLVADLKGHTSIVNSASFSPDGKLLVTASDDNTAKIWDRSGKLVADLKGHTSFVTSASFSPDGKLLVTASSDNTTKIWDRSGKLVADLKGRSSNVTSASFSPDGKQILTASSDNTAKVWRVENLEQLLTRSCNWLHDYLVNSPTDLEKLQVCQNSSILIAAAPSLVKEGEKQARDAQFEEAVKTFRQAKTWNPKLNFDPEAKAKPLAEAAKQVKQGEELTKKGNIAGAVVAFQNALKLDPNFEFELRTKAFSVLIEKGESLVKEGKGKEAIAAYTQAQKLAPKSKISADSWNTLCRQGGLRGYAKEVMFACEKAVALAPNDGNNRDSRGLARVLTGKTKGAIEDFQAFIKTTDDKESNAQRQRWIDALKAGKKPFTPEEIKSLLKQ